MLEKFLRTCGKLYLFLAVLFILYCYVVILLRDGLWKLLQTLSPFNIWNYIAIVIAVLPGIGLLAIADKINKKG